MDLQAVATQDGVSKSGAVHFDRAACPRDPETVAAVGPAGATVQPTGSDRRPERGEAGQAKDSSPAVTEKPTREETEADAGGNVHGDRVRESDPPGVPEGQCAALAPAPAATQRGDVATERVF